MKKDRDVNRIELILGLAFVIGWVLLSLHMEGVSIPFIDDKSKYEVDYRVIKYEYESQFESELEEALSNQEREVGIIGKPVSRTDIRNLDYSSFWMSGFSTYSAELLDPDSGEPVPATVYRFAYNTHSQESLERKKAEVDEVIGGIISKVPSGADDLTKIRIVHDQLCAALTYETTKTHLHIGDCYGLVNGEVVCSGYAAAFNEAMKELGIESEIIVSETHAWNRVRIGSDVFDVDVTWDDGDCVNESGDPVIEYTYYMLPPEVMAEFPSHQAVDQAV